MGKQKYEWTLENARRNFLAHVTVGEPAECWPWTGAKDPKSGHGIVGYKGRTTSVGRAAYLLFVGPLPDELDVRHTCDNPICTNWVQHLIPGTRKQNIGDMIERGRRHDTTGSGNGHAHLSEADVIRVLMAPEVPGYRKRLADDLGTTLMVIHQIKGGRTWTHMLPDIPRVRHKQARAGTANPWAILTEEAVVEIYTAKPYRGFLFELSRKFKVSRKNLTAIRGGRQWKHITKKSSTRMK